MKKALFFLILVLILSACGNEQAAKQQSNNEPENSNESKEQDEENSNNEEKTLTEIGQKLHDDVTQSTVELKGIANLKEPIILGPTHIIISDIKLLTMSDIENEELSNYVGKKDIDIIQIKYTVENTTEQNVELVFPIENLVLNTGEQIEVFGNDLQNNNNDAGGEFYGKVSKEGMIQVFLGKSKIEDITQIKLVTGEVWEIDGDILSDEKIIEVPI